MRFLLIMCCLWSASVSAQPVELVLSDLENHEHRLSDYRGKWVVVNYWATWCPPCVEEMPELVFFHDKHKDKDAVVLGVNMEDAPDQRIRDFLDEHFVSYPIVLAEPDAISPLGKVPGLPTTFIVTPEGKVLHRIIGRTNQKELEELIAKP